MPKEENKKEEQQEQEDEKKEQKEKQEEQEQQEEEQENKKEEDEVKESEDLPAGRQEKEYYQGVGRRKTSTAIVRIYTKGDNKLLVNGEPYRDYFSNLEMQKLAIASLKKMNCEDKFKVTVIARGGGLHSQAEAIRHGTARALVDLNPSFKKRLKRAGYLTRDPRMKERKKPGKRGARRSKQWQKR